MARKVMPVRITLWDDTGSSHSREFKPTNDVAKTQMCQTAFNYFALGHLMAMITSGYTNTLDDDDTLWTTQYKVLEHQMLPIVSWEFELIDDRD